MKEILGGSVTQLLHRWRDGDDGTRDRLMPLVYRELRRESSGHTLESRDLVREAHVRLIDVEVQWNDRAHFFGGMSHDETAAATGISRATAQRDLRFAKAWLRRHLSEN